MQTIDDHERVILEQKFKKKRMIDSYRILMFDLILDDMSPPSFNSPDTFLFHTFLFFSCQRILEHLMNEKNDEKLVALLIKVAGALGKMTEFLIDGGMQNIAEPSKNHFAEDEFLNTEWQFWPIAFTPREGGTGHSMVLGFNETEAVLFNVGLGRPPKQP